MNCPTCGAPDVRIHGDQWECTWCCDFGFLSSDNPGERKAVLKRREEWLQNNLTIARNAALTFVEAAAKLLPFHPESKTLAWKAILCQVSTGLIEGGLWNGLLGTLSEEYVAGRLFFPYRALANDLVDLSSIIDSKTMERAVRSKRPLFQPEGQLTSEICGEFWTQIIAQLPPSSSDDPYCCGDDAHLNLDFDKRTSITDSAEDLLSNLLLLVHFFADPNSQALAGKQDEDPLLQCFTKHWREARGVRFNPLKFFSSAVARIVEQFPELKDEYESEALFDMMGAQLLEKVYSSDPQKAIAMWRSVPEKQEPLRDPHCAEDFFYMLDFLWEHGDYREYDLTPLLDAIQEDNTLAEMVFRSSYVCALHLFLIQAAMEQDKAELAEHLYALLQANPLPREEWREEPDEFKALMEKRSDMGDSTPTYRYCLVRVDNGRRYVYLTAGLPVKRGDLVRVPYGKKNEPKEGVVRSVGDYTRDTAPWPPEKTKRVLEILPKPQEPVKGEPAAPKPQQVEKETVKSEVPPVTEETKSASDADTTPAAEVPQRDTPPQKQKNVPVLIVVAVVLVMVVGGVLLNRHSQAKQLAAWEQQYQTAAELFAAGNYKKSVELAEDVPENIAEQPALLTVAKAGVLLNANTEESLRDGLDLLEYSWNLGSYSEQGTALQAELTARLQETLYEKAISLLHKGDAYAARDCLRELGDYKDAATILAYTHALIDSQSFNVILYRWALESLQAIPPDYNGEFAEEIAVLRDALPGKIAEQEQIDAERAANLAQQQQQQKPKPPQTFNYGGGSTDTGPGSGHSLREDYGDPEDLYEDGDYDDLDEAWDEWEEGW